MNIPRDSKYLYFSDGDLSTVPNDIAIYHVSQWRGADSTQDGQLTMYFSPSAITDVATSDAVDTVVLTITDHTHKAVLQSLVEAIALNNEPLINVCDAYNSLFVNSNITDCAITRAA